MSRFAMLLGAVGALVAPCLAHAAEDPSKLPSAYMCQSLERNEVGYRLVPRYYAELEKRGQQCLRGVVIALEPRTDDKSVEPKAGSKGTGTAFRIGPTLLATAQHVEDAKTIEVRCPATPAQTATVLSQSKATDLAIITVGTAATKWLPVASGQNVTIGEQLFVVGYPVSDILDASARFTEGSVSALTGLGGDASFLQISAPIQPGNSGGPVVSRTLGVIGVVSRTAAPGAFAQATGVLPQALNFAVKADLMQSLDRDIVLSKSAVSIGDVLEATCLVIATQ